VIVNQGGPLVAYFEQVAHVSGDPKRSSNWVQQEVLRTLKEREVAIDEFPVSATKLGELVRQVGSGEVPSSRAPELFALLLDRGLDVDAARRELGIESVDEGALVALCRDLLARNPQVVADVQAGKSKAIGSLIGQAKKANPNIDPNLLRETCLRLINGPV
jgi:aspartyl-tRNA(Asn)/glutamyl-tRNA(Gln) amidotransferase subunit B